MLIVVDSLTGMSLEFAKKIGQPFIKIRDRKSISDDQPFFLITRCQNFGEIPMNTQLLLDKRANQCIGLAVSSNKNWGQYYGVSGELIEEKYGIKCILKFQGIGRPEDVELIKKFIEEFEK